ncbi:MAG: hypothetical protein P4L77_11735 [Sulfuriferula sp.]|nr:hypothetical protein [Sulfuriferula sp.]
MKGRTIDRRVLAERLQDQWHEENNVRLQMEIARNLITRIRAKIKPLKDKVFMSHAEKIYVYGRAVEEAVREWRHEQMPFCQQLGNEEWFNAKFELDDRGEEAVLSFTPAFSSMLRGELNLPILTADAPIVKYALGEPLEKNNVTNGTGATDRQADARRSSPDALAGGEG